MTSPTNESNLIDELETRQNDVLERLAELNARVEGLLNECLTARDVRQDEVEEAKPAVAQPKSARNGAPGQVTSTSPDSSS